MNYTESIVDFKFWVEINKYGNHSQKFIRNIILYKMALYLNMIKKLVNDLTFEDR
jgi:hypothetical protein